MSNDETEEEASFRERYAQELQKKKQQASNSYRGDDELADERRSVNQQEMRTPGCRVEEIKQEELDKEYVRRSKGEQTETLFDLFKKAGANVVLHFQENSGHELGHDETSAAKDWLSNIPRNSP